MPAALFTSLDGEPTALVSVLLVSLYNTGSRLHTVCNAIRFLPSSFSTTSFFLNPFLSKSEISLDSSWSRSNASLAEPRLLIRGVASPGYTKALTRWQCGGDPPLKLKRKVRTATAFRIDILFVLGFHMGCPFSLAHSFRVTSIPFGRFDSRLIVPALTELW